MVTAVPQPGYSFIGWSGNIAGTANPLVISNVISDMMVSAVFADITSPTISEIDPVDNTSNVPLNTAVTATFNEIENADDGDVTGWLLNSPDTPAARYVDFVYDEGGFLIPLGQTDKNLILYGLASCRASSPTLPAEWEPVPGESQLDLDEFAAIARRAARVELCGELDGLS